MNPIKLTAIFCLLMFVTNTSNAQDSAFAEQDIINAYEEHLFTDSDPYEILLNYIEYSGKTELILDVQSGWYEGLIVSFKDEANRDRKVLELTQSKISFPAEQIDAEIRSIVITLDNQIIKQFLLTTLNDSDPLSWNINK